MEKNIPHHLIYQKWICSICGLEQTASYFANVLHEFYHRCESPFCVNVSKFVFKHVTHTRHNGNLMTHEQKGIELFTEGGKNG